MCFSISGEVTASSVEMLQIPHGRGCTPDRVLIKSPFAHDLLGVRWSNEDISAGTRSSERIPKLACVRSRFSSTNGLPNGHRLRIIFVNAGKNRKCMGRGETPSAQAFLASPPATPAPLFLPYFPLKSDKAQPWAG